MDPLKRILIVSNRLPVKLQETEGKLTLQKSEGGLATALDSIYRENDNLWIGWPGAAVGAGEQAAVCDALAAENLAPVFLTQQEISEFYEGFSNETLWPLFHYFPDYTTYNPRHWATYKSVNRKFADEVIRTATKDDVIWVHDYQLMLVPAMVRAAIPGITIGFFLHIPFPSSEIFRQLPWKEELLHGVLGADLIGFHTYDHVRHFITTAERLTDVSVSSSELTVDNRKVVVEAFPISIDYNRFHDLAAAAQTCRAEETLKRMADGCKILISIDRLDYSKGIIQRLEAFRLLLEQHPELRKKIRLVQVIVPSRDNVPQYKQLKEDVDRLVGELNGRFGTFNWQPIHHFYRSFPPTLLSALYKSADVALVTPMRDGMNLVSKEYVASKIDKRGVLVLSEMAGASKELSEALMVNPNDIVDFAAKIYAALVMPEAEQEARMSIMQQTIAHFDIFKWSRNFMEKLGESKRSQKIYEMQLFNETATENILNDYTTAASRLILLDYDGTLVPFASNINAAAPDPQLLGLLDRLCSDPRNDVVITSGRPAATLQQWLGHLGLEFIAEHGAWSRTENGDWVKAANLDNKWKPEIRKVLDLFVSKTPGSNVEDKHFSLAWHYRNVEEQLGTIRAKCLINDLKHFLSDWGLQILQGDKVVEIKSVSVNKGKAAEQWLQQKDYDFVMAVGDDDTDEDTFKALPEEAVTIKVGDKISVAAFAIDSYTDVRALLELMSAAGENTDQGTPDQRSRSTVIELVPKHVYVPRSVSEPVIRILRSYQQIIDPVTATLLVPVGIISYLFK